MPTTVIETPETPYTPKGTYLPKLDILFQNSIKTGL